MLYCRIEGATCLLLTGTGKYFSLGLDLNWIMQQRTEMYLEFTEQFFLLVWRLLTFGLTTVAVLNGYYIYCTFRAIFYAN